jgi:2,5-diketo-D-gluconate reductase A
VNQVELHPRLQQAELRAAHARLGIATEAWSPLAQGALLSDPVITDIAAKHGRTPAQVVLRWHLQRGTIVFPKTSSSERLRENFALFDFQLAPDDVARIDALDRGEPGRVGPHPNAF